MIWETFYLYYLYFIMLSAVLTYLFLNSSFTLVTLLSPSSMAAMRSSPLNQFSECSFPHLSSFTGQGRTTFLFSCSWIERSARGEEKFQINFHAKRGCKSAAQRAKGIGKKVATSLQGYSNECVGCEERRGGQPYE